MGKKKFKVVELNFDSINMLAYCQEAAVGGEPGQTCASLLFTPSQLPSVSVLISMTQLCSFQS